MNRDLIICLVLATATLAVYRQVIEFEFVSWDDPLYVTDNVQVKRGLTCEGLGWALATGHAANWHPLTWLSHMLDCQIYGEIPVGHHLTNLLLHVVNTLLLFGLLQMMTRQRWPSALVAALFALHPLHAESVVWISERKDLLSTFFGLLSLWSYAGYVRRGGIARYVWTIVFFALGLLSKPMLVTLPLVMLLLDYWPLRRMGAAAPSDHGEGETGVDSSMRTPRSISALLVEKLPLLGLSAISSVVTFLVQRSGGAVVPTEGIAIPLRVVNAVVSYGRYVGKMIWPRDLSPLYPHPNLPGGAPWSWWHVAAAGVFLLLVTVVALRLSRRRYVLVGWLWYLGTLVPVIGLIHVGPQAMADRYTYVPLIGLFIMIAWGGSDTVSRWRSRTGFVRLVAWALALAVLTVMMATTRLQAQHWRDSLNLYRHAVKLHPGSPIAHNNFGNALKAQGDLDEAMRHYRLALSAKPDYAKALSNLGNVLVDKDQAEEAIHYLRRASSIDPHSAKTRNNLGRAHGALGQHPEAIQCYQQALTLDPNYPEAHFNLGVELTATGRLEMAMGHFRYAVRLMPSRVDVLNRIAWIVATHRDADAVQIRQAVVFAERAAEMTDYHHPVMLDTLAAAYAASGRFDQAVKIARSALRLAEQVGSDRIRDGIRRRLELYRQNKAYRTTNDEGHSDPDPDVHRDREMAKPE